MTTKRRKEIGSKSGLRNYEQKKGFHAMTHEEHQKHGRKTYEEGKGIGGLTREERQENAKKAALSKGLVPWKEQLETNDFCTLFSEKETAYRLTQHPDFQRGSKNGRAMMNAKLIAKFINELFHDGQSIRTNVSISASIREYRIQSE